MLYERVVVVVSLAVCAACSSEVVRDPKAMRAAAGASASVGAAGNTIAIPPITIPPITIPPITIPPIPDLSTIYMCDADAKSASSCGSRTCPEVVSYMRDACYINCCASDDRCGTRNTDPRFGTLLGECTTAGVIDDRCPSVMVGPAAFPGCCDAQNHCAVIVGQYCSATSLGLLGMPVRDCDAAPGADAGE